MNLRGNNLILKLAFIVSCSGMLSLTEMKTKQIFYDETKAEA